MKKVGYNVKSDRSNGAAKYLNVANVNANFYMIQTPVFQTKVNGFDIFITCFAQQTIIVLLCFTRILCFPALITFNLTLITFRAIQTL